MLNMILTTSFYSMHNSVFGKTMENVETIIHLRLTTDPKMAIKQFSMLNFKTEKYLEGLYMFEKYKQLL